MTQQSDRLWKRVHQGWVFVLRRSQRIWMRKQDLMRRIHADKLAASWRRWARRRAERSATADSHR